MVVGDKEHNLCLLDKMMAELTHGQDQAAAPVLTGRRHGILWIVQQKEALSGSSLC